METKATWTCRIKGCGYSGTPEIIARCARCGSVGLSTSHAAPGASLSPDDAASPARFSLPSGAALLGRLRRVYDSIGDPLALTKPGEAQTRLALVGANLAAIIRDAENLLCR